jgi:hypothetical protein
MNSIAVNNVSTTNLSSVGSADDALDMQQAIQFVVSDKIRNSILVRIDNTKNIGQRLLETNALLTRLRDTNQGNYQAITLSKFLAAKDNESDLINLLQSDGPKLGNSLIDSQIFLNELSQLNLNIKTNIRYPVLISTLDKDGNVVSTEFSFMNQSERDLLNGLDKVNDDNLRPIFSKLIAGDSPVTIHYESFDSNKNLIPSLDDINASITQLANNRDSLQIQFSKELAVLSASAMKIQEKLLIQQFFSKEDESIIKKNIENRKNELLSVLSNFELSKNNKNQNVDHDLNKNSVSKENLKSIDFSSFPKISGAVNNFVNTLDSENSSAFNSNDVISNQDAIFMYADLISNSVSKNKAVFDDYSNFDNAEFNHSFENHAKNINPQIFSDKSSINSNLINGYVQLPKNKKFTSNNTNDSHQSIFQSEKIDSSTLELVSYKNKSVKNKNDTSSDLDLMQSKLNNSPSSDNSNDLNETISKNIV